MAAFMRLTRSSFEGCVDSHVGGAPLADLRHLLPQRDAGRRVVAGAGGDLHADEIGIPLVVAVEFQVQQAAALAGELADVAADDQADGQRADIGERDLGLARAGVLAQGVRHLVAEHDRELVVGELEGIEDAGENGNLATRHAQGVDRRRLDDDDLPAPVLGAAVPLVGVRQQLLGDPLHPLGLRILVRNQRIAAVAWARSWPYCCSAACSSSPPRRSCASRRRAGP